jgi:cell division protein FtsQ
MAKMLKKKKKHTYVMLIALAVAMIISALLILVYFEFRVVSIQYTGSQHYTDSELTERIFKTEPNTLFYVLFGKKDRDIPFIQKYDVEIEWPNKMNVYVYEKSIIGYINYMGCKMYFDKDGIVVESSSENYEGVPEISGLSFQSIVLDSKLQVGDDTVFSQILELTQAFDKYSLDVSKVYFDSAYNITLYMGKIKVLLGNNRDYTDKLYILKQLSDKLPDAKGTLNMENYDGDESSIIFKKEN